MSPQHNVEEILLRGEDVARLLNISRSKAYQLMQQRKISTIQIGRSIRVHPRDLEEFIGHNTRRTYSDM